MVAIVAGNGIGLLNTSLNLIGEVGVIGQSRIGQTNHHAFVNAVTGNLVLQIQDEQLAGRGLELGALRTYNSLGALNDGDEDGWRWSYEQTVQFQGPGTPAHPDPGATVIRTDGDGHETAYSWHAGRGLFLGTEGSGAHDELRYDSALREWVCIKGSTRIVERYSNSTTTDLPGRLIRRTDTSDNSITLSYDDGRLTLIRDTGNRQEVRLGYATVLGATRLQSLETRALLEDAGGSPTEQLGDPVRQVTYGYDTSGRLTTVTNDLTPDGGTAGGAVFVTTYSYDGATRRIVSVTASDGARVFFGYDGAGRVSMVTDRSDAAQAQLVFSYSPTTNNTDITDGTGQVWTYRYDTASRQLLEIRTPAVDGVRLSTRFAYDASGSLVGVTDARNTVTYGYDDNGNRVLERDALGNTVTRTFSPANQRLTQTRYRIPDPDGAGPLQAGDALTERYAYDRNSRLRFTISPAGRVTEHRYGTAGANSGLLTHTVQYSGKGYDVIGLGPAAELTEAQLQAWVAALPDKSRVRLTEYGHDLRGSVSRETLYASVDAAGAGVLDDRASVTEYCSDAHGRQRARIVVRGSARDDRFVVASFGYDGMGRVVTSTDANGTQTASYDHANGLITLTRTSGLTETREYDSRGRLVRTSQRGEAMTGVVTTRESRNVYDNADRLRMTEDAQGGRRYRFYDAIGRLEFSVDATGAVARSEYNPTGQLIRRTQYLHRADSSTWFDGAGEAVTKAGLAVGGAGSDVPTDPDHDRVTTFEYDAAGRLTTTTEAAGTVTRSRYDGVSQLTTTQTDDRVIRHLYDRDGCRVGVVDPLGYLTESRYDMAGSLTESVRYEQRSPAAANLSAPVWIGVTNQNAITGKPFEYHVPAYDPDGDQLSVSVVGTLPSWLSFDASTATLRGSAPAAGTTHQVTVRADDGRGKTAEVTLLISVIDRTPLNPPGAAGPTWVSLPPLEITTDTAVNYVVPAATGTSLSYRVMSGLPTGLSFNPTDRTISGRTSGVGFSTIALRATNARGRSVDRTLSVRILAATTPPDQPVGSSELADWRPASTSALRSHLYYDGHGRVVGAVDEQQFLTETMYDDAHNMQRTLRYLTPVTVGPTDTLAVLKTRAGASQQTSVVEYDGFGRVLITTAQDGSTQTHNEYDDAGRLTRVIAAVNTAEPRARRTFYNAFGDLTAALGGEGDASLRTSPTPEEISQAIRDYGTRSEYDTVGRAIRRVDANGNVTLLYYDAENRLTHTISVIGRSADNTLAGEVSETTYTSFGQPASVRRYALRLTNADMDQLLALGGGGVADPFLLTTLAALAEPTLDSVTSSEYDRNGRLVKEVDSEGGVTGNVYSPHGELEAEVRTRSSGVSTTRQLDHDLAGQVVSRTDDVGGTNASTQTAYDAFGRVTSSIDELGNVTTTAYRDSGRVVVVTDPLQRAMRTEYEALGRVLSTTNALNQRTEYFYDDDARRVTVATPQSIRTTMTRTRHGEPASSTDGRGNATIYAYNRDGQPTVVTDPLGQETNHTTYDRSGRAHEVSDARGTVTRLGYDQRSRVTERRVDPTGLNLTTTFEFDALGRQTRLTDAANTVAARTTTYRHDRKGRVTTKIVDPGGLELSATYSYDHRDNIVSLMRGTVSNPNQHATYQEFDSLGRRTTETSAPSSVFGDGASGSRNLTMQYRYAGGRLSCRIDANRMPTWHVYDAAGQLTHTISALGDVNETSYDAAGRLVYRRRCAARLGPATVDGFGDTVGRGFVVPPANANDHLSYLVYDADGRARFTLTATGSRGWTVVENRLDANGNIVENRRYDRLLPNARITALDSAGSPGLTVPEIEGELSATLGYHDDTPSTLSGVPRTRLAYDANNRLRFTVDPLGSVAESVYDAAGSVLSGTRFATRPALTEFSESAIDAAVDRADDDNSVTCSAYDPAGRLRYTVDALGSVRENRYDERGNVVTRVRWATRPKLTEYSEGAITAALAALPADGDDVTRLAYDTGDRPRFTFDALASISENTYDALGNVLTTTRFARRPTAPIHSYTESEVDAAVDPLRVDAANQASRFAHDPNGRLRFSVDALGSVTEKVYDAAGNVVVTTRFATRPALRGYGEGAIDAAIAPLRTDPANSIIRSVYDGVNRLRYTVDALGSITEHVYDTVGNLTRVLRLVARPALTQFSEGALNAAVAPHRDDPGNQLQHYVDDAAGQVRFSLQRVSFDAGHFRYAVTRHDLDAFGQTVATTSYAKPVALSSFSEPAVSAAVGAGDAATDRVSRFIYDLAGHQTYTLAALSVEAGQRRYHVAARQFDAFGRAVGSTSYATAVAVSTFDKTAVDAAVAAIADASRDRVSTAAYDPQDQVVYELRLLGPGQYQVVEQDYDALGRIAKMTRYARAVGPLADIDRGTIAYAVGAVTDANDRKTVYVYDAAGRPRFVLQTDRIPRWSVSESRYDTMGNVIESRRYDRPVTDDWMATVDTVDSPGGNEDQLLDKLSSLGYHDDNPSSLANPQRTRFAYDTSNQLRFTVDALGSVAESRYDALGRVHTTVRYAERPTLTEYTESAINAALDVDGANNQVEHRVCDAGGQLRFTIQVPEPNVESGGQHLVTEQRYDALGQLVESRAYATPLGHLTAYDEASVSAALVPDPPNDRRSATAYDSAGRPAYTLHELFVGREGGTGSVVTKHAYDGLRQLVQRTDYAVAVPRTPIDVASIDAVVLPDPATDRTTVYVYDAGGRLHFEVHPDLSFTETVNDALGNVIETRQFDFVLPSNNPRTEADLAALRGDRRVGDGDTRGQTHSYDAAGRLTSTRDALNNIERYKFNPLGDRTAWIDKNDAAWTCEYDRKGQKTSETSPPLQFKISGEPLGTAAPNRVLETRFVHDAFGNVISKIEAANLPSEARTTDLHYDTLGRLIGTLYHGYYDPASGTVMSEPAAESFRREATTAYDPVGNPVRSSLRTGVDSFQHTYRTYDRRARVVHEVNALNNVTTYAYTSFDEPAVVTRQSVTISSAPANGLYLTAAEVDPQLNWGYDENGNLVPDGYARPITMVYDKLGRKVSVTQPSATYYSTQAPGDPSQVKHYRPNATSVVGVEDAAATTYEYNAFGDLTRQRVRINNVVEWQETTYTYDARSRQIGTVNAAEHRTFMRYDMLGNLVRTDEPSGFSDGRDRNTVFAYNALNQQTRVDRYGLRYTDANGDHGIAYWSWEDGGHWVDPDADVATTVKTTTYDGYGRVLSTTDGAGNVTSMRYNALGQLVQVIEPERLVAPLGANDDDGVDPFRNQVSETPVTSLTLDAFGHPVRLVQATSQAQDMRELLQAYDVGNNLVSTTDAEGNVRLRSYDFAGRVTAERQAINADLGPLGTNNQDLERRYAYDALGQLTDTLDVYAEGADLLQSGQSVAYNAFGEVVEQQRKWGPASQSPAELTTAKVASHYYDNAGHLIDKLAGDGLTVYFHNLQGFVTREEKRGNSNDADNTRARITETQYDVLGRAIMIRKPAFGADVTPETGTTVRVVTPYTYRSFDRWGNIGNTEEGGYEFVNGQPVYAASRLFRNYGYDDDSRLVRESRGTHEFVSSTGTSSIAIIATEMFRDLLGNVVREVDEAREPQTDEPISTRTRRKEYTSVGQIRAEIDGTGRKIEYAYSIHGNQLGARNAHGTVSFNRYDRNGSIRFSGVLRTTSPAGVGEYDSFTGAGTVIRTYLTAHMYDQANRRFASKNFTEAADAPWTYTVLDGRGFGVMQRDETGIVTQCRYDQFGNKSVEIDGAGAKTEWIVATDDYVAGRIARYSLPTDTGLRFGSCTYNDLGELAFDAIGNARTEYDRKDNGLLGTITILRDVLTPDLREATSYDYDARGQMTYETRFNTDPALASQWIRYFSYDWLSGDRLIRVEDHNKAPFKPISDVHYSYDEWDNVRRQRADYTQTVTDGPRASDSWNAYDDAGRMTFSNGKMSPEGIGLKLRTPGSVEIVYDDVGRRRQITEFIRINNTTHRSWDTVHDERYDYDDLGHLRKTEQRIRHIHIVSADEGAPSEHLGDQVGDWQPLSTRSANLRGDVTHAEQWSRVLGAPNTLDVDMVPVHVSTTTTRYRADGQVTSTETVADNPVNSSQITNTYSPQTGLLESYEFTGHRSDQAPYTTTFVYQYTFQNGNRVVHRISDTSQNLDTKKTYDLLGRLSKERVELPNPDDGASDRYDERLYDYSGHGSIILKDTTLRLSTSDGEDDDLPTPRTGQLVYVGVGNRTVAMVGANRLVDATRFDFAYTPMSEAATSGASRYVVRNDDTLIDIAQAVYGDSALWQLIAEANSIAAAPDEVLPTTEVGKAYEIPSAIRASNSATTFTPYHAAIMIGNDRPMIIPSPPPPRHSVIAEILVSAASITIQVGVTVGLSALGVPAPISAFLGAGLSNLAGQAAAWGLGMQHPGQEGIDWFSAGDAAVKGAVFSSAGKYGTAMREVWEHGTQGWRGWVSDSGPNFRGIAGSMFNIGLDAQGPEHPRLEVGQVNFSLGGLINNALNPNSGWAVPGTGKSAAVGLFEYGYGAIANGAASMGYEWVRRQLVKPSAAPPLRGPQVRSWQHAVISGDQSEDWELRTSVDLLPEWLQSWADETTWNTNKTYRQWVGAIRTWWGKYQDWEQSRHNFGDGWTWDDAAKAREALPDRVKEVINSSDVALAGKAGDTWWLSELGYVEEKTPQKPMSEAEYYRLRDGYWDYSGVRARFVPSTTSVYNPAYEGLIRHEENLTAQGLTETPGEKSAGTFEAANPYEAASVYYSLTKQQLRAANDWRHNQATLAKKEAAQNAGPVAMIGGFVGVIGTATGELLGTSDGDTLEGYSSGVEFLQVGDAVFGMLRDASTLGNGTVPYRPEIVRASGEQRPAREAGLLKGPSPLVLEQGPQPPAVQVGPSAPGRMQVSSPATESGARWVVGQLTRDATPEEIARYKAGMKLGGVEIGFATPRDGSRPLLTKGDPNYVDIPVGPSVATTSHTHVGDSAIFSGLDIKTYREGRFLPDTQHSVTGPRWPETVKYLRSVTDLQSTAEQLTTESALVTTVFTQSALDAGGGRTHWFYRWFQAMQSNPRSPWVIHDNKTPD